MKVAVFGGTGFVGTYLLYELSKENSSIKSTFRKENNKELTMVIIILKIQMIYQTIGVYLNQYFFLYHHFISP